MSYKTLKEAFFSATSKEIYSALGRPFHPSVAIEVLNGVSGCGIARYYDFPGDRTPGEYEDYITNRYSSAVFRCYQSPDAENDRYDLVQISHLDRDILQDMRSDWSGLVSLNPELQHVLRPDDLNKPCALFDALAGAASLFNPDDIEFFVRLKMDNQRIDTVRLASDMEGYQFLYDKAEKLVSGPCLSWVPSPQTLRRIITVLSPGKVPASRRRPS